MIEEKTTLELEAIEKETRKFTCPCCQTELQFRTRINITSVGLASTREEIAERDGREVAIGKKEIARNQLLNQHEAVLTTAKKCGVFDAFNRALDVTPYNTPTDRDKYFIQWLKNASKQKAPQYAIRQCLEAQDIAAQGDLELFGTQNVSVILSDGEFKVFVPKKLISGEVIETLTFENGGIKAKRQTDLQTWIRTKYGYVAKSKEFSNELRKHSIGGLQVQ